MNKLLAILSKGKIITIFFLIGYSFFLLGFHEKAGKIFESMTLAFGGREKTNTILLIIFLFIFLIYILFSLKYFISTCRDVFYFLVTVVLGIISVNVLLVNNIEFIHFFQYSILTIFIFRLYNRVGSAIFLASLFGVLDESYQYYNTYDRTEYTLGYFDFNDVCLNILGAGFGGITVFSNKSSIKLNIKEWFLSIEFLLLGIIFFLLIILTYLNVLVFFNEGVNSLYSENTIILNQQISGNSSFWTVIPPQLTYHIIKPLEGIILAIILLIFYLTIDLKTKPIFND